MSVHVQRAVVHGDLETVLGSLCHALRDEGLHVIARFDVRDHFRRNTHRDFRPYVLVDAWSPDLAIDELGRDPDAGPMLPTRLAVYELPNGDTAVAAGEARPGVDGERERIARVFAQLTSAPATSQAAS